ncbi:MAG: hypothetical protein R3B72_15920 [Polyangiaceae bacterium]
MGRSSTRRFRVLLLSALSAGVFVASLAASCAIPGFDQVDGAGGGGATGSGGAGSTGGTSSTGGNAGAGGAGACGSVEPPGPPSTTDPGSDVEIVVALRSMDFGETLDTQEGPTVGVNLDKECTCDGGEPTCSTVGSMPEDCDGPGGRDNAVARFFNNLNLFESEAFSSEVQSQKAEAGDFSMLFRITGYNGQANDQQVTVAIYSSPGFSSNPCLPNPAPQWDGSDEWPVDVTSLNPPMGAGGNMGAGGGCGAAGPAEPGYDVLDARFSSDLGYVTNHVLVANLPDSELVFSSKLSADPITLVGGFVMGTLVNEGQGWALRGALLTGRWPLSEIFSLIGSVESAGMPLCTDNLLYPPIKTVLCNYPDITASVAGPATPCDSLSFGMAFEAEPAKLGIAVPPDPPTVAECPPGTDPADDGC